MEKLKALLLLCISRSQGSQIFCEQEICWTILPLANSLKKAKTNSQFLKKLHISANILSVSHRLIPFRFDAILFIILYSACTYFTNLFGFAVIPNTFGFKLLTICYKLIDAHVKSFNSFRLKLPIYQINRLG